MDNVPTNDLSDDEPRFNYLVGLEFACSDLLLVFDKQASMFLLNCENEEGVSVKLTLTLRELEHAAIKLLLAARGY
jgi:hypothetical protein